MSIPIEEEHCYHHEHDSECNEYGDCDDDASDDCVGCECCCTSMAVLYGPKDGMLLFDPTADEPFAPVEGDRS
jgi:hypothetical protein